MQLEVCLDNLESLQYAQQGGATRIELCSALHLGGLTPTTSTLILARRLCNLPIHALIRPRQGDFLFSDHEVESMLMDVFYAKEAKLDGVVIGALNAEGRIDTDIVHSLMKEAGKMSVTFHRAIDQSSALMDDLDALMHLGCHRVLTSGQATSAWAGRETLKNMVKHANGRIGILAGGGIHAEVIPNLCKVTGVEEIHLSGKSHRLSLLSPPTDAYMGSADLDDRKIPITDMAQIRAARKALDGVWAKTAAL